jgi:uncharacterized membrane protein
MRDWLLATGEITILVIDAIALLMIIVGTLQTVVTTARAVLSPLPDAVRNLVWMRYMRWLSGALTFLLAADIVETALSKDWQNIAHVAAVAVVRTFLNYFLARDEAELRAEQRAENAG